MHNRARSPRRLPTAYAHSAYQTPYPDSIPFVEGERVQTGERETDEPDWGGWIRCTGEHGQQAWIHESFLDLQEPDAVLTRAYDARELSVRPGDALTITECAGGFAFCKTAAGAQGWVPLNRLDVDDDDARVPLAAVPAAPGRRIPLRGAHNLRDLGGYFTLDGRRVRRNVLFRSDALSRLTRSDWSTLSALGIRSVVDFREPYEVEREPDKVPEGIVRHWLPVEVGGKDLRDELRRIVRGGASRDAAEILVEVGRSFVLEYSAAFAKWLRILVDSASDLPQVFHCSVGKDRTGFASAVLLRMLGVPDESVYYDYLASDRYLHRFVVSTVRKVRIATLSGARTRRITPLLVTDRRYLDASFAAIREHYGTFDGYVRDGLNVSDADLESLKGRLLESSPAVQAEIPRPG
jgi:protein-tyrosine phosphatase